MASDSGIDGGNGREGDSREPDATASWTRRRFLQHGGLVGASVGLAGSWAVPGGAARTSARVERRVTLGRTGIEVPDIGFGTFTLESDEDLVRYALDRGITHFDTAESYTEGRAEEVLGRALRGRRHEVTLTSKNWAKPEDSAEHQMQILERSLRRLETDYLDLYLNHAVNDVARLASPEWQAFTSRAKEQGKIRHVGMSGHAGRLGECVAYALDHDLVDTILVAYNFAQQPSFKQNVKRYLQDFAASFDLVSPQPELPGLMARAKAQNVGVMVMKTLKGARQNDMRPFESAGRTFSQAAFRWVLSDPAVDALIVTMESRKQVDEYLEASGSGPPDAEDLALLGRYEMMQAGHRCSIGCDACVEACPASVPIADVMRMRMYALDYEQPRVASREYAGLDADASACLQCTGAPCAKACPAGLSISELNRDTHRRLA